MRDYLSCLRLGLSYPAFFSQICDYRTVSCKCNDKGYFDDLRTLELDRTDIDPSCRAVLTSYAECDRGERKTEA